MKEGRNYETEIRLKRAANRLRKEFVDMIDMSPQRSNILAGEATIQEMEYSLEKQKKTQQDILRDLLK